MKELFQKNAEKIRFLVVGGLNTAFDFILLFLFVGLGIDKFIANYLSTGSAMVLSFFLNRSFTFKNTDARKKRQFALFLLVTITGMWAIQPLVIWVVTSFLDNAALSTEGSLFIAKVIATIASLMWNYLLYSKLVFKKSGQ